MEFDKGLELAVTLGWNDLMTGDQLLSARVEYLSERGKPVDLLTIWTVRSWGYQNRVCDYWTSASTVHPRGVRFSNKYLSDALAKALDFIMKNQDQFTRPADASRPHLVLIQPPTTELAAEAAAWMAGSQATAPPIGNRGTKTKAVRQMNPRHGSNGAGSSQGMTQVTANSPFKLVDSRTGFPNGPWCR